MLTIDIYIYIYIAKFAAFWSRYFYFLSYNLEVLLFISLHTVAFSSSCTQKISSRRTGSPHHLQFTRLDRKTAASSRLSVVHSPPFEQDLIRSYSSNHPKGVGLRYGSKRSVRSMLQPALAHRTLLLPQSSSSRVSTRYGASLSRCTTIILVLE
jgi:hypothetical protein